MTGAATQRIFKLRRDYNAWVANETMEDYALRFTPRSFRKWGMFRVANTAMGAVSFLALEAIGATIALNYGFSNALWAILVVGLITFLTGLPISYYAAKYGVDMDLLTRGAGFGYLGSTMTSLIYASFTFIFFAIEAAIMALALEMCFGLPLGWGYVASSLGIIPLVAYGITLISRLQAWTQPLWVGLLLLPFAAILYKDPQAYAEFTMLAGRTSGSSGFDLLMFGAAATVAFSLLVQVGEQVDFLRFLPEKNRVNRRRWWAAVLLAGAGWILPGMAKQIGGAFLAFVALQHELPLDKAVEPARMYLAGFGYVFSDPGLALAAMTLFVVVSQVKINVTNAYAGSLAWSNFFARLTHSHPGRVVWLVFNVLIALMLMSLGVFKALEHVLGLYSNIAIAWVGALVADLVINKPLGLSPKHAEFKRAHLYDVNPVGFGAMTISAVCGAAAYAGAFGETARAFSPFIALALAFVSAPLIAVATRGRFYIARPAPQLWSGGTAVRCCICENTFESEDMAHCPAYDGPICSLCCTLEARCHDLCKERATVSDQIADALNRTLPAGVLVRMNSRVGHYLVVFVSLSAMLAAILGLVYYQSIQATPASGDTSILRAAFGQTFAIFALASAVGAWLIVLGSESRRVAQEESNRQTLLLTREIEAHRETDAELQRAKETAETANLAKTRYVTGMTHELRTPLNSILGYAQILQKDASIPVHRREAIDIVRRSGEHLLGLVDGLLDLARIEAGKLRLDRAELRLGAFLDQVVGMFQLQAESKGLGFRFEFEAAGRVPEAVYADIKRLRQILVNLLGNAIKFTDHGSVTLRVFHQREIVRFEVEDTGIGIPQDEIDRIFLPFERTSGSWIRGDTGTGLGLPITKLLTELMGGEISVVSKPGSGSTFAVRIYMPEVTSPTGEGVPGREVIGFAGPPRAVLIVDDQTVHRQLLAAMLTPLGFRVIEAATGEACLREVAAVRPDAVLLDISMPGMDGWETCRLLKSGTVAACPVIMVTANMADNLSDRKAGSGCDDFIGKPVMESELLEKLRLHLGLDWRFRASPARVPEPAQRDPVVLPPSDYLKDLLRLGRMGYVKGIHQRLDELELLDPGYATFVRDLRALVRGFRLEQYSRVISEHMHAHDSRI